MNNENFVITDNKIYYEKENKVLAEIDFKNGVIVHTFVDESLRGLGIASKLVELAVSEINKQGLKPSATCSYAKAWLEKYMK